MESNVIAQKRCSRCNLWLSWPECFYACKRISSGRMAHCKTCHDTATAESRTPESRRDTLAKYGKKLRAQRTADGLCLTCGRNARPGRKNCQPCMDEKSIYVKKRVARNRENGWCIDCGGVRTDKSKCLDCRLKTIAHLRFKKAVKSGAWLELKKKLEDQDFKCAYSGLVIMPGVNASIDHIVPRSRGGSNELANLQWVDLDVNKMKGAMTEERFLFVCRAIADKEGGKHGK